jgi:hypothetical protein
MKYLLPIIFLVTLVLFGCEKKPDNWTNLCSDFEITYTIGSGWTGYLLSTTISYPDSLKIYEREYIPSLKQRTSFYKIDKKEIDSLFHDLQSVKNINLTDYGFGPNKPTDYPVTNFRYVNCCTVDSASIYVPDENEVPIELSIILGRINRIMLKHDTLLKKN